MNKKITIIIVGIVIFLILIFVFQNHGIKKEETNSTKFETTDNTSIESNIVQATEKNEVSQQEQIEITDADGEGVNYSFIYKGEEFRAKYTPDNWHIYDSYKIENRKDRIRICQALIDIHPIHGQDRVSFRTAEDMAYEWFQHNLVYNILSEDDPWKARAGSVDFDPDDQDKSLFELYQSKIK